MTDCAKFQVSIVACLAIFVSGCNSEVQTNELDYKPVGICQNACIDERTLMVCQADGSFVEQNCDNGCMDGACLECGFCQDGNILIVCNSDGTISEQTCLHGCEDGTCKSDPMICNRCEGDKLVVCHRGEDRGKLDCKYGCSENACRPNPCGSDGVYCADQQLLVECRMGQMVQSYVCEHGCENGTCVNDPMCVKDGSFCYFGNLVTCQHGIKTEIECQSGCENNACIPDEECESVGGNGVLCDSYGNSSLVCEDGVIVRTHDCAIGCHPSTGECKSCTDEDSGCNDVDTYDELCLDDRENDTYCVEYDFFVAKLELLVSCKGGVLTNAKHCASGCENNACMPDEICLNGNENATFCEDESTLVQCKDGYIVSELMCASGCTDNACGLDEICMNGNENAIVCEDNKLVTCKNGFVRMEETCKYGCAAEGNRCKLSLCESDGNFCTSNQSYYGDYNNVAVTCQDGKIVESIECYTYCSEGKCMIPDECGEKLGYCFADNAMICDKTGYVHNEYCEFGCLDGECISDPRDCHIDGNFCMYFSNSDGEQGYVAFTCQEGNMAKSVVCNSYCDGNSCRLAWGCDRVGVFCDGDELVTCKENGTKEYQYCTNGCQNDACIPDDI